MIRPLIKKKIRKKEKKIKSNQIDTVALLLGTPSHMDKEPCSQAYIPFQVTF